MAEAEKVSETKPELSLVCQSDIVFSDPGDDVVLSCHLKPATSAVSMEIMWWNKANLVCHYKDGQMIESCEGRVSLSLEDLQNGNVSLTLRDVRRSQKGHYICKVIHGCQTLQDTVFLHISSEDFSIVGPNGTVSADTGSDVILPVHLSPETSAVSMKIRWLRRTDLIYQYMNGLESTNNNYEGRLSLSIQELERGNVSLTLRNVQESDSGDYTCKVYHEGCLQTVHLQVRVEQNMLQEQMRRWIQTLPSPMSIPESCSISEMRKAMAVEQNMLQEQMRRWIQTLPSPMSIPESCSISEMRKAMAGPTARRRNSKEQILPFLKDDDDTVDQSVRGGRGTRATSGVERESGDENRRQTREENTATEQETPGTSSQALQRTSTSESVISHERATQTQEKPGATMPSTQEGRQESESTEQQESERTSQ